MPTSSFDRSFVVTDPDTIEKLNHDLENPRKAKTSKRDLKNDAIEGLAMLKKIKEGKPMKHWELSNEEWMKRALIASDHRKREKDFVKSQGWWATLTYAATAIVVGSYLSS